MDQEKIGKFIKELRIEKGLTQSQFAEMLGVSNMAVSKWERGINIPDISIVKEISEKFGVSIGDILLGEVTDKNMLVKKSKKKLIFIILGSLVIISLILFLLFNYAKDREDFEFKTLTSNCSEFEITGSMAYNSDKSSIYISNISYCGGKPDMEIYDKIECALYEKYNGETKEINSCPSKGNILLDDFLEDISISVDDYATSCKEFSNTDLYLEITASEGNKKVIYNIPITINDNCPVVEK